MDAREHWERIYAGKPLEQMSWHRPHLKSSLALIERVAGDPAAAIIDVGGGASTLVDDLTALGYRNVTVLDISRSAIGITRKRLGEAGGLVRWVNADVTDAVFSERMYDVWHDRAVFHFLTEAEQRRAYVRNVLSAVKPGGYVIVSTFGLGGPKKCSGLDVVRYDAQSLTDEFGARFRLMESFTEMHQTPWGTGQEFLFCCWELKG
jgi:2-polyprenyl-3-methyl-5-hydroxy-6-metoxy-1,4-benzoquinol methylase